MLFALIVIPRSRSRSIESSTCAVISRWLNAPVSSSKRSASVDLPWSMCAMMQKFRMYCGSIVCICSGALWGCGSPNGAPQNAPATRAPAAPLKLTSVPQFGASGQRSQTRVRGCNARRKTRFANSEILRGNASGHLRDNPPRRKRKHQPRGAAEENAQPHERANHPFRARRPRAPNENAQDKRHDSVEQKPHRSRT